MGDMNVGIEEGLERVKSEYPFARAAQWSSCLVTSACAACHGITHEYQSSKQS